MPAIVVLPPHDSRILDDLPATGLAVHDIMAIPGPDEALDARVCAAIHQVDPEPPLVVVAAGAGARHLPAVARAQRSVHRRVAEYLLIEPDLPAVTDVWPDAPVTVVADDEWVATQARLRGWDLIDPASLPSWRPRTEAE